MIILKINIEKFIYTYNKAILYYIYTISIPIYLSA